MKRVRLSRKLMTWVGAAVAAIAGVAALAAVDAVWTDYLWYASLSQQSVFWTRIASQASVWLLCTAVGFVVTYAAARSAWKAVADKPRFNGLTGLACFVLAGAMSWTMSQQWMVFRLAVARSPFGLKDPMFGLDVGFFVFILPAIELFNRWLTGLCVLAIVVVVSIVFVSTRLDTTGELRLSWSRLKRTLSVLAGLLVLTAATNFWIGIWRLSFSTAETPFAGASYADVHAQLPANWVLVGVSVLVALVLFATAGSKQWKPVAAAFVGWAILSVVVGSLWPILVQNYVASPNEATLEAPYIARNIAMTRSAYDLAGVKGTQYPALESVDASASAAAAKQLSDATIWTPKAVTQAFGQLQQIRPYYQLSPIDYDRYAWGGSLHQVLVSAREINPSALPSQARTWVNRHLVYTHGYGLAISSTSRTSASGFPQFIVGDVPPRIIAKEAIGAETLNTVEPRIYFAPDQTDWVIVNTGLDEFDYPAGEENVTYRYKADSGIPVGGFFRRLAWAIRLQSSEMIFSKYLHPDSRIMVYRGIQQRARKIAPWLSYDPPYAAIVDGHVVWIMDGYTSSDHYPYAQALANGTDYLRDSVKVTVDALTGEMKFFANGEDPVRDAWAKIFPSVITPGSEMPTSVAKHIRAPQKLFSAQAYVYRTYHMTDTRVFYNREDLWQIPNDASGNQIQPAFLMLDLPDHPGKGMYLLQPYSLPNKANLVGWMAMSCEPGSYGQRTVYLLPKDRVILGSAQVSARINQDPKISQQLSLWNQPGSNVSFGTMLVLPVENTVAYIQPIFQQASQRNAISELVSVIAVNGDRVVMDGTLDGALAKAWGTAGSTSTASSATETTSSAQVDTLLKAVEAARAAGDWAAYGAKLTELRSALDGAQGTTAK